MNLRLRVNGCTFPASKVGFDRVVLIESAVLPEGPAEVIAEIDGEELTWPVAIENRNHDRQIVPVVVLKR